MIIVLLTTGFPEDETLFTRPGIQTDCDKIAKCRRRKRSPATVVAAQKSCVRAGAAHVTRRCLDRRGGAGGIAGMCAFRFARARDEGYVTARALRTDRRASIDTRPNRQKSRAFR
jgi:hypothetical protein